MKTIKKVVNGLLYSTENAKKIGEYAEVDRSDFLECILFLAPNGHYFLAKRSGCFNEDDPHLIDFEHSELNALSKEEAHLWATEHSVEALAFLEENGIHAGFQESILLTDFRQGTPGNRYVHHVVFKASDGSGYIIASNCSDYKSLYPFSQTLYVSGVDGVEDFCEDLYLYYMCEEEAKRWAEKELPADNYIQCFGPVPEA